MAVKDIKTSTVKQCFAKAGILPELIPEEEPMVDLSELQQVIGIDMNAERFVDFDNDLLTSDEDGSLTANNKEDESCDTDEEVPLLCEENKKSYKEMLVSLKE
ncbi:uncharacterized protein LOC124153327 [Ischnura elegans]|uniref:uncharacterized protein LOC124153327 n=1 Tax=Ischnura elegans TaxID=197161 RepID=UPI001ED88827|nr:uncharacterized protein LOC124153327 [Ischnura elegans]